MKRKAKELQLAKREARKGGRMAYTGGFGGGFGSHDIRGGPTVETLPPQEAKLSYQAPRCVHTYMYVCLCVPVLYV